MTFPLFSCPSLSGVLPDLLFLQNLPSVVVGHVLDPQPGEIILDMCAAPGEILPQSIPTNVKPLRDSVMSCACMPLHFDNNIYYCLLGKPVCGISSTPLWLLLHCKISTSTRIMAFPSVTRDHKSATRSTTFSQGPKFSKAK